MPNSTWTETGSSVSLAPSTTTTVGSSPTNVNYLTNSDKIALIAQYGAELAIKTQLDTLASTWSVSSSAYDAAVASINTTLSNAGAPSNWATLWPDGTTFGPVLGIQTLLAGDWTQVASTRAALQASISAAQAAAAQAAAVSTAASNTIAKLNTMALTAPGTATWASTAKPALPSSSYPAGSCWLSTDGFEFQVSADGTAWNAVTVAASGLFGEVLAAQLTVADWTNLCYNPGFENGLSSWTAQLPTSVALSTTHVHSGTQSLELLNGGGTYAVNNNNVVPAVPGQTYQVSAWAMLDNPLTSGDYSVRFLWNDSSGGQHAIDNNFTPTASWAQYTYNVVVPAGAVSVQCSIVSWSPVGGNAYFDDYSFRRCADASLIVDGSVTAAKLQVGAAVADIETVGSLTANVIYFSDGFCLNTLEPKEAGANVTAGHVLTSTSTPTIGQTFGLTMAAVTNWGFTIAVSGPSDVYNIWATLAVDGTADGAGDQITLKVRDTTAGVDYGQVIYQTAVAGQIATFPYSVSITGLSAGTHTLQFYAQKSSSGVPKVYTGTYAICQRIF